MAEEMRLQKFLSRAGVASRRAAEELIRGGRVHVNGVAVTELGTRIDPDRDRVEVDGRRVTTATPVWIALHKPRGYVSTRSDPQGRPTIYDLLPRRLSRLFHVGRLDIDSEGLLLLTNQGDLANRLLHPRHGIDRVYEVVVTGTVTEAERKQLLDGVALEDGLARAVAIEKRIPPNSGLDRLRITLREGRKREVRRMFRAIGHPVRRLRRLRYGPISLGRMKPGAWRRLTTAEIAALEASVRDRR
jgi:23S rRNA pseudouridine2605 synthase